MAVYKLKKNEGSGQLWSFVNGAWQARSDREIDVYRVTGVTSTDAATAAAGVPQINSAHPTLPNLLVSKVTPKQFEKGINTYDVTVEYTARGVPVGTTLPGPTWSWSSSLMEEQTQFDINKKQIVNAAGEAFDGSISRTFPIVTLHYESSVSSFTPSMIFSHVGRVNASAWTTTITGPIPAKCAKVTGIQASTVPLGTGFYYRVSLDIAFRSQLDKAGQQIGWAVYLLNSGFMYKNAEGKLKNIKDADGVVPKGGPWSLSADGTDHSVRNTSLLTDPNYLKFDIYETADFAALGLP